MEQFRPAAPLDLQARAELAWAAAMISLEAGDDTAAAVARQRLAPLLPGIQDPFLHAACQLAMGVTWPVLRRLRRSAPGGGVALEELRGEDVPVFTAIAAFTVGWLETVLGRYDDALRHSARHVTWPSGSVVIGLPRAPRYGWASWLPGRAASMRPGRCWPRRWT